MTQIREYAPTFKQLAALSLLILIMGPLLYLNSEQPTLAGRVAEAIGLMFVIGAGVVAVCIGFVVIFAATLHRKNVQQTLRAPQVCYWAATICVVLYSAALVFHLNVVAGTLFFLMSMAVPALVAIDYWTIHDLRPLLRRR